MRRTTIALLLAAAALAAAMPAMAQSPTYPSDVAACTKSGTTITCNALLHEFSGGFHMVPERVDANVRDTVVFHVTNLGASPHNLMLCGDDAGNAAGPSGSCAHPLAGPTRNLAQNESADLPPVKLASAGTFYYYCALPGHAQGGMFGELKVQGGSTEKKSGGEAALGAILALAGVALLVRRR